MSIKSIVKTIMKYHRYNGVKKGYISLYQQMVVYEQLIVDDVNRGGGIAWKAKWCKYDNKISPLSYQIFSRYIGEDVNIIPLEILAGIVEPVLTPEPFRAQYGDKNNLELLLKDVSMPETLVRNINGIYYEKRYNPVEKPLIFLLEDKRPNKIVLKPTRESSGRGVELFELTNNQYVNSKGNILTEAFLEHKYKSDFIIQVAINQSPYMAQFNPSSVNTLRIATYKSVKTGQISVINSVMRVGSSGKNVDNAHSGGMFVGINKDNGCVGRYACNWLGQTEPVFNDVDFSKRDFQIPNWGEVCRFAKQVSSKILFGDLVALDIALDVNNLKLMWVVLVAGYSSSRQDQCLVSLRTR